MANPITVEQYEEFEGFPGLRDELINGRIIMNPQPKPLHQQVVKNVFDILRRAAEATEYIVNGNSNIQFAALDFMPAPDVFVVKEDDWFRAIEADAYLDVAPLLVVEVKSESNRSIEEKLESYLLAGVENVWVAEPKERTVTTHTLTGETFYCDNMTIPLPAPLAGLVSVDDVFLITKFSGEGK